MSKRQRSAQSVLGLDIPPIVSLNPLVPWLSVQANVFTTMRRLTDGWYARRAADIASLQEAADQVANFRSTESLLEAQGRCATALTERFIADLSELQDSLISLGRSAGDALGGVGSHGSHDGSASKLAAE